MLAASPEPDAEEWAIHGATRKSHLLSEAGMPLVKPPETSGELAATRR